MVNWWWNKVKKVLLIIGACALAGVAGIALLLLLAVDWSRYVTIHSWTGAHAVAQGGMVNELYITDLEVGSDMSICCDGDCILLKDVSPEELREGGFRLSSAETDNEVLMLSRKSVLVRFERGRFDHVRITAGKGVTIFREEVSACVPSPVEAFDTLFNEKSTKESIYR